MKIIFDFCNYEHMEWNKNGDIDLINIIISKDFGPLKKGQEFEAATIYMGQHNFVHFAFPKTDAEYLPCSYSFDIDELNIKCSPKQEPKA